MDSRVHGAGSATVPEAGERTAARGRRCGPLRTALGPAVPGPGHAGRNVLACPLDDAPVGTPLRCYRYSTNHQVVIDADSRLVVVIGRPLPGNRNDCKAWAEFGARAAVGQAVTIADGGYQGAGLLIPHRRERGKAELAVSPSSGRATTALGRTRRSCRRRRRCVPQPLHAGGF